MNWDHSWAEANRTLCWFLFNYQHYFPFLPITLTVAWQLLLVSYNAKVVQLPCCNASCKGTWNALQKCLCWAFGVSTIVFVLLWLTFDICLTCCGTILYLTNLTLKVSCLTILVTLINCPSLAHRTSSWVQDNPLVSHGIDNLSSGFRSLSIIPLSMPNLDWPPSYVLTWLACVQQAVRLFKDLGSTVKLPRQCCLVFFSVIALPLLFW